MFRKTLVAVVAAALVSTAALTPASAGGHHMHGLGFALGALGFIAATAAATNAADTSCLQLQTVVTPRGHYKTIIVNVCDQDQ
jgi:hypothetical protein